MELLINLFLSTISICISALLPPHAGLVDVLEAGGAVYPLVLSLDDWVLYTDLLEVTTEMVHKRDSSQDDVLLKLLCIFPQSDSEEWIKLSQVKNSNYKCKF